MALKSLGIDVQSTAEAVALVQLKITLRDDRARKGAGEIVEPLPEWVGKD